MYVWRDAATVASFHFFPFSLSILSLIQWWLSNMILVRTFFSYRKTDPLTFFPFLLLLNWVQCAASHTKKYCSTRFFFRIYEKEILKYMRQQRCALLYRSKQTNNIFFTFATYPQHTSLLEFETCTDVRIKVNHPHTQKNRFNFHYTVGTTCNETEKCGKRGIHAYIFHIHTYECFFYSVVFC